MEDYPLKSDTIHPLFRLFTLVALHWTCGLGAHALDPHYSPFSQAEAAEIKATSVKDSQASAISATVVDTGMGDCVLRITIGEETVYEEPVEYYAKRTQTVVGDIDGNGLDDVVKEINHGSQGLGLGCDLLILSQHERGRFARLYLPSERFTREDICDVNGDGKRELITCVLVRHEGHSYWVYRAWRLGSSKLVSADSELGFPRAIRFTEKPNHGLVPKELLKEIMVNYPAVDASSPGSPTVPAPVKQ